MIRRKRSTSDIAVPQNVYRHLQAGFAESNAPRCVEYEHNRIFHPGDAFIDVLRWLWEGIEGGESSPGHGHCHLRRESCVHAPGRPLRSRQRHPRRAGAACGADDH